MSSAMIVASSDWLAHIDGATCGAISPFVLEELSRRAGGSGKPLTHSVFRQVGADLKATLTNAAKISPDQVDKISHGLTELTNAYKGFTKRREFSTHGFKGEALNLSLDQ